MQFRKVRSIISMLFVFSMYCLTGGVVIALAEGYTFNQGEITQTGSVFLDTNIEDATVFLNNVNLQISSFPAKVTWLVPGTYHIILQKENYYSWERKFHLNNGEVKSFHDIVLVPQKKEFQNLTYKKTSEENTVLQIQNHHTLISSAEEQQDDTFLGLYGNKVSQAQEINKTQILIILGHDLFLQDKDGENKQFIAKNVQKAIYKNETIFFLQNTENDTWQALSLNKKNGFQTIVSSFEKLFFLK